MKKPHTHEVDDAPIGIKVEITAVIEREFKRRDIFPELRLGTVTRINGATRVHIVTLDRAREILADAETQNRNREHPRGIPKAYGSLAGNIERALKEEARRGVFDDPGIDVAMERLAQSVVRFDVGDKAFCSFDDYDEDWCEARIVGGYRFYGFNSENGAYVRSDGTRFEYRFGYLIQLDDMLDTQKFFAPAHRLTDADGKPTHLRLVASRTAADLRQVGFALHRGGDGLSHSSSGPGCSARLVPPAEPAPRNAAGPPSLPSAFGIIATQMERADDMTREAVAPLLAKLANSPSEAPRIIRMIAALMASAPEPAADHGPT